MVKPCAVIVCSLLTSGSVIAALKHPVRTEGGLVSGVPGKHAEVTVFRGIPYAAPPVGPLRWQPPQPPLTWEGVRTANRFGASCVQGIHAEKKPWTHEFLEHGEVSEDCLFLNIWTPAARADEKRAVLVYLHGGANIEGSGAIPLYGGEGLAHMGIIMVTINYRLGVFGFMAHPELSSESPNHVSGNYGILDQIAALRWVHDNIAAFGGDPERVTVAGQSAGAFDIAAIVVSPLAKGLFQGAIFESGGPPDNRIEGRLADSEADGLKFAGIKGAGSLAELRAMSWREIFAPPPRDSGLRFTRAIVDGYAIPASPDEIYQAGNEMDVPMLMGINADENGAKPGAPTGQNEAIRRQQRYLQVEWAASRLAGSKTPAFLYFYNHVLPGPEAAKYGAFHSSEIPYVLNNLAESDRPFTQRDHWIADELSSYWVNFAERGDPNGRGLPHWPSTAEQPRAVMELGDRYGPIPVPGGRR
jgi:para-nitrobenzyl esterase